MNETTQDDSFSQDPQEQWRSFYPWIRNSDSIYAGLNTDFAGQRAWLMVRGFPTLEIPHDQAG